MTTRAPTPAPLAQEQQTAARRHVLDLDDFTAAEIDSILDSAEAMREVLDRDIKKVPSLRGKVVMTIFLEPSTRTRVSFEQAGKMLSADVINISGSGQQRREGRVAAQHSPHAPGHARRHHHPAPPARRRTLPAGARVEVNPSHQRRRRTPRPSHAGAVGPHDHAQAPRLAERRQGRHHRRRPPQQSGPLGYPRTCRDGRVGRALRPSHDDAARPAPRSSGRRRAARRPPERDRRTGARPRHPKAQTSSWRSGFRPNGRLAACSPACASTLAGGRSPSPGCAPRSRERSSCTLDR